MPWDSSVDDLSGLTDERMKLWIREAAGDHDLPIELERAMAFDFGVALADRFRAGDAFLIGDAAHRVTPRGGTGLNTAVRDGFDLGWKLAWVLRGWAGDRPARQLRARAPPRRRVQPRALDPRRRLDPRQLGRARS